MLALALAAAGRVTSAGGLVASYALAWLAVEISLRTRLGPRITSIVREQRLLLVLAAIVPALVLFRGTAAIAESEGLRELSPRLADRLRLAPSVTIAPPLVVGDRPQVFFVRAREARDVRVEFESDPIVAVALGHGVFRVELDPRMSGLAERSSGTLEVNVEVDGAAHRERLPFVRPLAHPRVLDVSSDARALCAISEETDELRVGPPGALVRHATSDGPVGCAFAADTVLVASRYADRLEVWVEGRLSPGPETGRGATGLAAHDGVAAVVRSGEVRELVSIDVAARRVDGRVALEGVPLAVELLDARRAVVATRSPSAIVVVALGPGAHVVRERRLVMPAVALVARDAEIVIATTDFGDPAAPNLGNHFIEDQLVWLDAETLEPRRIEPTGRRTVRQDHAGDLDRGLSPVALALDPARRLLVAFAGSHELGIIGPDAPTRFVDLSAALVVPSGVVSVGERIVVSSAASGVQVEVDGRSLAMRSLDRWAPDDATLLREAPEMLRLRLGERTFWESTRAGASCQSCHTLGSSDGEGHNIGGRVIAPTLDVRGLAGTAPFLRDGSYPYLGDLHEVAVLEYRGYRASAGDRHATLDAWLRSLPVPTSHAPREPERESRGLDAFFAAGCPACHAPPAFTNLARHAARTVFPDAALADEALSLDVPPLRNLRDQEPYLFDGRARTLREVLTDQNATNHHGDTSALDPSQLDDLIFFLETL